MRFLCDILLQDLALRRLGVSKVHHLIHEFVYDDKVVANTLFFKLFEVLDEDLCQAMQKDDDFGRIRVTFR